LSFTCSVFALLAIHRSPKRASCECVAALRPDHQGQDDSSVEVLSRSTFFRLSMIPSENRSPLFRIMLSTRKGRRKLSPPPNLSRWFSHPVPGAYSVKVGTGLTIGIRARLFLTHFRKR
jgi:hypothetical protein